MMIFCRVISLAVMVILMLSGFCYSASNEVKFTGKFIGLIGVWEDASESGKYYVSIIASRCEEGAQLFVEADISDDWKTYKLKSISNIDDKNVALLPIIVDGKIKSDVGLRPGLRPEDAGTSFYYLNDKFRIAGKTLTLDHFTKDKAIWKSDDGKFYTIDVCRDGKQATYSLTKIERKK